MGRARWRTGSSRRTSSRKQVAHIRHPQQQRQQRHSKPESKIFHFGFQILKITSEEEFSSNLNLQNKKKYYLTHHKRSLHVRGGKERL
jgi:hypothetical protein